MKQIIEFTAICVVSILLVIFASLYFVLNRRQKKLNAAVPVKNGADKTDRTDKNDNKKDALITEWAEQLQIMQAQLDLMRELSPVFTVCYDYGRNYFSVSENGQIQLGFENSRIDQKEFEDLIHPDDMFIYEEITGAENIRQSDLAKSPYVLRLRQAVSQNSHNSQNSNNSNNSNNSEEYGKYLTRIKPVYDENGISAALILAFVNTEYLEEKNK